MCAWNINICFTLRNISYKYNKCVSFFIEGVPASVLKSDCAIYVSMIIDLRTLWKVSKAGFVISKDGCCCCSLKPMKLECVAINKSLIKWLRGREQGCLSALGLEPVGSLFPLDVCVSFSFILIGTVLSTGAAGPVFHCVCKIPHGFFSLGLLRWKKKMQRKKSKYTSNSQDLNSAKHSRASYTY